MGEFGSGSEIKVLDANQVTNFENAEQAFNAGSTSFTGSVSGDESGSESGSFTSYNLTNFGSSMSTQSDSVKQGIFGYYANLYCPGVSVDINSSGNDLAQASIDSNNPADNSLSVNPDHAFNFDEKNLKSTMNHEKNHFDNYNKNLTNAQNEINTLIGIKDSVEFKNASREYRESQVAYLKQQWAIDDTIAPAFRTMRDACQALGVPYRASMGE